MSLPGRLSLVQWLSPAFPTGAFAYSHGLEQAMTDGAGDADAVAGWVGDVLTRGGGWTDAVILALALRGEDVEALADIARAMAGSAERLAETMDQGRAFGRTVQALSGQAQSGCAQSGQPQSGQPQSGQPLPVAVGVAARRLDLPADEVIAHYLHAFAGNLISAAMRFLPLGQLQGQAALAGLHPLIAQTATRAARADRTALQSGCMAADLAAMRHETLETRIFLT